MGIPAVQFTFCTDVHYFSLTVTTALSPRMYDSLFLVGNLNLYILYIVNTIDYYNNYIYIYIYI